MTQASTILGCGSSASSSVPARVGSSHADACDADLVVSKDLGRERDALRYADFTLRGLLWWKRAILRFERVFELNQ